MRYNQLIVLFLFLVFRWAGNAQNNATTENNIQPLDSITISQDTTAVDSIPPKKAGLDARVDYQAKDTIIMTADNWAYLFGEDDVKYEQIQLQSEKIEINMDSSIVYATYGLDSLGQEFGYPLFIEGGAQYESKTMRYNFDSKKGYISEVITQQGEGFVTANQTKKMPDDALNMVGGKYTTCDDHEHPHFYIHMTKAKVRPKKNIVTGPVYMVFEDVPIYPLMLPFCFFPFSDSYSSGILMPTYVDESTRGFGLRDGGYYFAFNDYIDLALTGEIYTKGSWGIAARSTYKKRYKYSGAFNLSYLVTKLGEKGMPDYSLSKDFKISWQHTQDSKANPYRSFSASVNFSTSSYDRNQLTGIYNNSSTSNTKSSSISFSQRFPNSPFSISATMNINQSSRDSSISLTLPNISITMSRIYPFKRKVQVGKERWYEKISMSYTGQFRNSITTKENLLFKSNLIRDWDNGMQHEIPISMTFPILKYINITPNFSYTERWYTHKVDKEYDMTTNQLVDRDTTYGFYRVFNYTASVSASTTLYGFFKPLPFLGDKIEMIRHRLEPSVSISYAPDFGASRYGYWKDYIYTDRNGNLQEVSYSPFEGQIFSPPGRGKTGSVNFALSNNLEMKVKSDKDSTGFKKISLIDDLSLSMSYNMAADSFKWSDLSASLRLKLTKSYTLNLSGSFDTYTYDENGRRVDVPRWKAGKGFGRLRSTSLSFSYTLNNDTFKKWFGGENSKDDSQNENTDNNTENTDTQNEGENTNGSGQRKRLLGKKQDMGEFDSDGYMVNKVPWSLSLNLSASLAYGEFDREKREYKYRITPNFSFSGNIQPTKNWKLDFNGSYDIKNQKLTYLSCNVTRDLHCFRLTASFIPVGMMKSYTFTVAVSSSLLKDLKYSQSNSPREVLDWY